MDYQWISIGLLGLLAVILYIYKHAQFAISYWRERAVPAVEFGWQFRNLIDIALGRTSLSLQPLTVYQKLAPHKYGGQYAMLKPVLMIRDPELIKKLLIKDFHYFHDRGITIHDELQEPLAKQLSILNGEQWKNLRIKMTTTFTSGKMKAMLPLIEECAVELASVVSNEKEKTTTTTTTVDIKDFVGRYLLDSISSCAFGVNMACLQNPNSEFRSMASKFLEYRYRSMIRLAIPNLHPKLIKLFQLTFFSREVGDYFTGIVKEMLEYREKNKVIRNDFLNLMINLRNNFDIERARKEHKEIADLERMNLGDDGNNKESFSNIDMTLDMIASQCFLFLSGGFEATSLALTFLLYEVSVHTDIQEKMRTEIDAVLQKYDQQLTYYALNDMKYMDMVIAETLRVCPPASSVVRVCNADYKLDDGLVISKGTPVVIPVIGLHYDEQYYQNPKIFNPENFTENAKQQRHQFAYLPFGEGPRICIAERFAKMQIKVALTYLIKNCEFKLSPTTKLPVRFGHNLGLITIKNKIFLQCRRRV